MYMIVFCNKQMHETSEKSSIDQLETVYKYGKKKKK